MQLVRPIAVTDAVLTATNVAEAVSAWAAPTTYALGATIYRVIDNVHQGFTSAQNGNTGRDPATDDGTWWTATGPTNRWAMFDASVSSQTSNANTIEVELTLPSTERMDAIYLAGLEGVSVRIQVEDPTAGPVYDQTFSLADTDGISGWFEWFFEPVSYRTELLVTDLPYGAGSIVTVTINNAGGTARCGALVTGFRKRLGDTRWGVKTEIRDYSQFIEDEFGNRVLVERAYRKIASCEVILENRFKDAVERELAACRAQVRLYIADEDYTTLAILGTGRWAVEMSLPPSRSLCSLQLESIV